MWLSFTPLHTLIRAYPLGVYANLRINPASTSYTRGYIRAYAYPHSCYTRVCVYDTRRPLCKSHSLMYPSEDPDAKIPSPQETIASTPRVVISCTTGAAPTVGGDINPAWGNSARHIPTSVDVDDSHSSAEAYKCGVDVDIAGKNWSRNWRS